MMLNVFCSLTVKPQGVNEGVRRQEGEKDGQARGGGLGKCGWKAGKNVGKGENLQQKSKEAQGCYVYYVLCVKCQTVQRRTDPSRR